MDINAENIISVTEANQNFSKVSSMVEKNGEAIIFKRNKPKFLMLDINNEQVIDKAFKQLRTWNKQKGKA